MIIEMSYEVYDLNFNRIRSQDVPYDWEYFPVPNEPWYAGTGMEDGRLFLKSGELWVIGSVSMAISRSAQHITQVSFLLSNPSSPYDLTLHRPKHRDRNKNWLMFESSGNLYAVTKGKKMFQVLHLQIEGMQHLLHQYSHFWRYDLR